MIPATIAKIANLTAAIAIQNASHATPSSNFTIKTAMKIATRAANMTCNEWVTLPPSQLTGPPRLYYRVHLVSWPDQPNVKIFLLLAASNQKLVYRPIEFPRPESSSTTRQSKEEELSKNQSLPLIHEYQEHHLRLVSPGPGLLHGQGGSLQHLPS